MYKLPLSVRNRLVFRRTLFRLLFFVHLFLLIQKPSQGEVTYSSESGFGIHSSTEIAAPPSVVYDSLVNGIASWWHPSHTYTGDAGNLSIDARAGGCFCEQSASGLSVQHAEVIFARPGHTLRMKGALGPLQEMSVNGTLTIQLSPIDSGAVLDLTYRVAGYSPDGLGDTLAAAVDGVLASQMERLKLYVEGL